MLNWAQVEHKTTKEIAWLAIATRVEELRLETPTETEIPMEDGVGVEVCDTVMVNPDQYVISGDGGATVVTVLEFNKVVHEYRAADAYAQNLFGIRG